METDMKRAKKQRPTQDKTSSTGSKKVFDPELESFTKRKLFRFESFSDHENLKYQKLSLETLIQKILFALNHYYPDNQSNFSLSCRQFLSKGYKDFKLQIIERLSTYDYFQKALGHKQFTHIETEIIKQWQKNKLIHQILNIWIQSISKSLIKTSKQFKVEYDLFRELITQISYLIFKNWFLIIEKHKKIEILDKLFEETTHFIITEFKQFKNLYSLILDPMIKSEIKTSQQMINWPFNLQQLDLKNFIYDKQRQKNLPQTIRSMKKFTGQIRFLKKFQYLREIRLNFQKQVLQNQKILVEKGILKGFQMLQKDDIISGYIYCILAGQVTKIQPTLFLLQLLLGRGLNLLTKMKIDVTAVDLKAATKFLSEDSQKETDPVQHFDPILLKIQSNPEIQLNLNKNNITGFQQNLDKTQFKKRYSIMQANQVEETIAIN